MTVFFVLAQSLIPTMHFDATITLGNIIELAGIVVVILRTSYVFLSKFQQRFNTLEATINTHAAELTEHSSRMREYEADTREIIKDVQRLIGRLEVPERRMTPRGNTR